MKKALLFALFVLLQLNTRAQNCTFIQSIDTANNAITFTATDTVSLFNYIFVLDTVSVLNNLTGGHSASYQGFLNDTMPHEICLKIVDLINQVVICEVCTTFQLVNTAPPSPSCAFTYYFSNDTLYASQSGGITPADYVWNVNGNFYNGTQLVLYVGNIDSIQVNLNGENTTLGTNCFNSLYAVNPFYQNVIDHCNTDFVSVSNGLTSYFIDITSNNNPLNSTYNWDLGDGSTSISRNIQHTYLVDGDYNVCLRVTDTTNSNHCNDTICKIITVNTAQPGDACSAFFVFSQIQTYSIGLINLASGVNPSFSWNFGDGAQSILNGPYPSYTYLNAGTYQICLNLITDSCNIVYCDSLTVDSIGIMRNGSQEGFTINVISPTQATGINEATTVINSKSNIKIYPNPSSGIYTISSPTKIEVYNIIGELIVSEINATSIDLTKVPRGVYVVRLNGGKIEKLIKN